MKKNKAFQQNYTGGRQEVATCRHDASKDVESACSRDGSHGKVKIEETDGSCCGQKEQRLLKLRRSFPPWWKQVRGPALAVMCETRDLGIKWSCWHTLVFNK